MFRSLAFAIGGAENEALFENRGLLSIELRFILDEFAEVH